MLEYFTYKKVKKHREEKAEKQRLEKEKEGDSSKSKGDLAKSTSSTSTPKPVSPLSPDEARPILDKEDEKFLERLTSPSTVDVNDDETPPPLPPRVKTPFIDLDSDTSSLASKEYNSSTKKDDVGKGKAKEDNTTKHNEKDKDHKPKRFSFANISLKRKPHKSKDSSSQHLAVPSATTTPIPSDSDVNQEINREETDIAKVLADLELASDNDKPTFSLSRESADTVRRFTQVLKDLVNGVPTAYSDLVTLIEDRDTVLARSYEKLPRSLKKLVAQLPEKLTSSLAPELLAVAAEAQGLAVEEAAEGGVKTLLSPGNLMELVTKPGAVVGLLKGIVNALKVRWPAFVGTNVLWSVAVFLLLSALWYCYKRGRETRLEKEAMVAGEGRVVEVEIDEADGGEGEKKEEGDRKLVEGGGEGSGDVPRIEEPKVEVTGVKEVK